MSLLGVGRPIILLFMKAYESTKPLRLWIAVSAVCLLLVGCNKPSADYQRAMRLLQFQETMAQVGAVIEPGMQYSDLVKQIGQPFICSTNGDAIMAIYHFDPAIAAYGLILTNGYRVDVSKGIVVTKSTMTGTLQLFSPLPLRSQ
jgi:hypothetical protein